MLPSVLKPKGPSTNDSAGWGSGEGVRCLRSELFLAFARTPVIAVRPVELRATA